MTMRSRKKAVERAESAIGKPYILGLEVKDKNLPVEQIKGFDCSELLQWAYHGTNTAVNVPDGSDYQIRWTLRDGAKRVSREYAMRTPGVICGRWKDSSTMTPKFVYHVGMTDGKGQVIHAANPKAGIGKWDLTKSWDIFVDPFLLAGDEGEEAESEDPGSANIFVPIILTFVSIGILLGLRVKGVI